MFRIILKSKIHRATVTDSNIHYQGSITIDKMLLKKANIIENEEVMIVNLCNGERWETYVIEGEEDSGIVCVNGGGARLVQKNDLIIIMSFGILRENEVRKFKPLIIHVDKKNRIVTR